MHNNDLRKLEIYLKNLSQETKNRFAPHGSELCELEKLFFTDEYVGFISEIHNCDILVAYAVLKKGIVEHDRFRLQSYGLKLDSSLDCTYAPSVAEDWQSQGIGSALYQFVINYLKSNGFRRIILWGGVQATNEKALNYYRKYGFVELGSYEYYGQNYDMMKEIF